MRTFIALELPEAVREAARAYQEDWRRAWTGGRVSWVRPAGFHVTLRFLGEISERQASDIGERLGALADLAPVATALTGPLIMPPARPRILALATAGPPDLLAIAQVLDRALHGLRLEPRDKPFRPHLTIGRVRDPGAGAPDAPPWERDVPCILARAVLVRSLLDPGGSRYDALAGVDFSGRPAGS